MTDTPAETPIEETLTIEMRRGDKFVRAELDPESEAHLGEASAQQAIMRQLVRGMVAHGAVKIPLPDAELRNLAVRSIRELISSYAAGMTPEYLADDLNVTVEEATKVSGYIAAATVTVQ